MQGHARCGQSSSATTVQRGAPPIEAIGIVVLLLVFHSKFSDQYGDNFFVTRIYRKKQRTQLDVSFVTRIYRKQQITLPDDFFLYSRLL